jgi:hypothetical protein
MAHASWVTPNKQGGSGNDTVSWSASAHTGRSPRTTTAVFAASGVESKILNITQSGKAEFVELADTATVSKDGGTVTITGKSNSSKLTFSLTGANGIGLVLPSVYIANSVDTNNGAAIAGDPGASQEYTFSITFTGIGANASVSELVSQLTVTTNNGETDTCTITQAAGDAFLTISPTSITIPAAGTAQSVTVSSNTSWTIS